MKATWIYLCLAISIALSACKPNTLNKAAEASGAAFYTSMQGDDLTAALSHFSPTGFDSTGMKTVLAALEKNRSLVGKVTGFKKNSGWNINTSTDSGTTVYLLYEVTYEHGISLDSLTLFEEGDGSMKIFNYKWNFQQADYLDRMLEAEDAARAYLDEVNSGQLETAYSYVGYHGTAAADLAAWTGMLAETNAHLGPSKGVNIEQEKSDVLVIRNGASEPGYYYTISAINQCAAATVQESLLFYQPDYNKELKLVNHGRQVM